MKMTLIAAIMFISGVVNAQVMTPCLTMEQTQAQYNQSKANATVVRDTASQQLQCYYQQLATYWQQRDTENQQAQKDIQQKNKDIQQKEKDEQQKACDKALTCREVELQNLCSPGYDEVKAFIEALLPLLGNCDTSIKEELKRIHTNRSGHMDGTNPGGQTHNIRGFDNPHKVR